MFVVCMFKQPACTCKYKCYLPLIHGDDWHATKTQPHCSDDQPVSSPFCIASCSRLMHCLGKLEGLKASNHKGARVLSLLQVCQSHGPTRALPAISRSEGNGTRWDTPVYSRLGFFKALANWQVQTCWEHVHTKGMSQRSAPGFFTGLIKQNPLIYVPPNR